MELTKPTPQWLLWFNSIKSGYKDIYKQSKAFNIRIYVCWLLRTVSLATGVCFEGWYWELLYNSIFSKWDCLHNIPYVPYIYLLLPLENIHEGPYWRTLESKIRFKVRNVYSFIIYSVLPVEVCFRIEEIRTFIYRNSSNIGAKGMQWKK